MPKTKFYAVRVGREGSKIYETWSETERAVRAYPYAQHKSFNSKVQAQEWIDEFLIQATTTKLTEDQILKRLYSQYDEEQNLTESHQQAPSKKQKFNQLEELHQIHTQVKATSNHDSKELDFIPLCESSSSSSPPLHHVGSTKQEIRSISNPRSLTTRPQPLDLASLSSDQAMVFQKVLNGRSVFFTGSAGTGKSHLLKFIIDHLRNKLKKQVFVTASTGIAASLIRGSTLHSFVGLGLAKDPINKLCYKLRGSFAEKRWTNAQVLIIDEVSMIDGDFFDKLNHLAKWIRKNSEPFGGIQLILTGDFFQLPPVTRRGEKRIPYVFETKAWDECITEMLVLKHVFRQADQAFVDILNEIRYGQVSQHTIQVMKSLTQTVHYSDGIQPAELYPTQYEVKNANEAHLRKLVSPEVIFNSNDRSNIFFEPTAIREILDKNTLIAANLTLKVGAQVMLVKNLTDDGLVNGSIGIVVGFVDTKRLDSPDFDQHSRIDLNEIENNHSGWPQVLFTNGKTKVLKPHEFDVEDALGTVTATRIQVPLILAWALSIHKSQGQSLDRVKVDLTRSFEAGQVYVALSRATCLNSIQVVGFHPSKVMAHQIVLDWARQHLD